MVNLIAVGLRHFYTFSYLSEIFIQIGYFS